MFDPEYLPNTVTLLLAGDGYFPPDCGMVYEAKYNAIDPRLKFEIMIIPESVISHLSKKENELEQALLEEPNLMAFADLMTRDAVVIMHGGMDLSGLEAAARFVKKYDSRVIVAIDPSFARRNADRFRKITGFSYEKHWPCDPKQQIGFLKSLWDAISISGNVVYYLRAMAALRGER
jgi:hypothetical protein